jgi:hypothetical protein
MVKALLVVALAGTAHVGRTDMGKWDCNGSPTRSESVQPGTHVYVWRGECSGAEGFSVVVEPNHALATKQFYDASTKELELQVTNTTNAAVRVAMHVFVGFA